MACEERQRDEDDTAYDEDETQQREGPIRRLHNEHHPNLHLKSYKPRPDPEALFFNRKKLVFASRADQNSHENSSSIELVSNTF